MRKCKECDSNLTASHLKVQFCSNVCYNNYKKNSKIKQWLNGEISGMKKGARLIASVREYLIDRADHKCELCGWCEINSITGKSPLEINHVDGDATNNRPENLQVVCPNCHSLTPTWKALNKGNGNKERLRYSGL
jgi:hypothetical protein